MKNLTSIIVFLLFSVCFTQATFAKNKMNDSSSLKVALKSEQVKSVNLNKANAKEIAKALKGVGLKKAQAIIDYREAHGDFKAVEELASVKGIGVATIAKNHNRILLK